MEDGFRKKRVQGRDLKVGDVLLTWAGAKTITHFDPHPGVLGTFPARIACSADWVMTVEDDGYFDIADLAPAPCPKREAFASFLEGLIVPRKHNRR